MTDPLHGVGWGFPVRALPPEPQRHPLPAPPPGGSEQGAIELSRDESSIRESIMLILGTARGERVMRPTFGCGLQELVFEPNDTMTAARASSDVRDSLIDWEPRIEVLDVQVGPDPSADYRLLISVDYLVKRTSNVFNLVYPLYLQTAGGQAR